MATNWFEFKVYPDTSSSITAKYQQKDGIVTKIKIITHVARGDYYSVFNAASETAQELINKKK